MRCSSGNPLMLAAGPVACLFFLFMLPALAYDDETRNDGRKLLKTCEVALEYLDNDLASGDIESVRFCDDYLTGFRENENVKEIHLQHYYRDYCFPYTGITNGELVRVIVKYLQANESEQQLAAYTAIRDALVEEFPCSN